MSTEATDRSRLEQLEREAQRERALQRVTSGLSSAATHEEILRSFLDEGSRVLAASAAVAYLLEAGTRKAKLVAHVGMAAPFVDKIATATLDANLPVMRSMRDRVPVWLTSREQLDREAPEFPYARQAVAALPLFVRGEVVGGIAFAFPETHAFDGGERDFVTSLAGRVQAAMERAHLLEESQQARAAAERSRAEAEALLRFNEIVSGILAHDLRNPLAAVLMNAHILNKAESERSRTIGARIVTSGERMSRMIDQILEWTRLRTDKGGIQLTRAACDLGAVAEDVVSELRLRRGDVPIAVERRGELRGNWDADRLAQVVSNLVSNAIDHATKPGVAVSLNGDGPEVLLAVENEGNIEPEMAPHVFEPFRGRASGSRARGKGLGLGLYITRQIIQAHGGQVLLEAERGQVRFVAKLPRL
jgi:signal transduction histidine kinase